MTRRLTGNRCQCAACGLYLTSPREFDRHRTGAFARAGEWRGSRRCLQVAELIERGWRQDGRGFWMQGRLEGARAGIGRPCGQVGATGVKEAVQ